MPITLRNSKYRKTKRYKKTKRNTKKYRRRTRGGVKGFKTTPITDPVELRRLEEADRIAEERERNDNEIRRINADLERQRINTITSFPSTPMSPEDARRQQQQDLLDNARVNSKEAKSRKLTVADLGGSKGRKYKKSKKIRGGNRIGGNNIGANCNEPNFSIYNTNLLKLFPYKGGSAIPPESNLELLQSPEEEERQQIEQQRLEDERQRLEDEEDVNNIDLNELDNIRRQNIQDEFIRGDNVNNNNNNNFDEPEMERLSLSDLGGSNNKKNKKSRKSKKCKKRKGGNLKSDDIYKNNEGPQF